MTSDLLRSPGLPSLKACDTIPAPQNLTISRRGRPPSPIAALHLDAPLTEHFDGMGFNDLVDDSVTDSVNVISGLVPPPGRKLCVRHQRMADEGTSLRLQKSLDALPLAERETVNTIWSTFSSSSHPRRALILQGLLTMCCSSQLSLLSERLPHLIRTDPFFLFPREVSLKVLKFLDAKSLARAAQVSKDWKGLADDDILWRNMCEQHIEKKCAKCGWGLPLLEKKRVVRPTLPSSSSSFGKRRMELDDEGSVSPKRQRTSSPSPRDVNMEAALPEPFLSSFVEDASTTVTRPWKSVYRERLGIERNWRRGRYMVTTLKGHTDGVMCLQFSETLAHPSFPILMTGSMDRTVRVWNLETGQEVRCMRGHSRAVRALQFDEAKLITASMDRTLKVWDWRSGKCIRTLEGHTEGVVCLNFGSDLLASGSVDTTVKVWNFRTGECFTLRGHKDWVNAVILWDGQDKPNKMLFSASDDGTVRLWDLALRVCVRQFEGHVGQVQSIQVITVDQSSEEPPREEPMSDASSSTYDLSRSATPAHDDELKALAKRSGPTSILISGSLDNTIRIWDVDTAICTQTLFGHIEGVWAVACDKLRLVSASHDRTIKVWNRDEGSCVTTLVGHRGAVTCLALGDDKIVSGGDDGDIRLWDFAVDTFP